VATGWKHAANGGINILRHNGVPNRTRTSNDARQEPERVLGGRFLFTGHD